MRQPTFPSDPQRSAHTGRTWRRGGWSPSSPAAGCPRGAQGSRPPWCAGRPRCCGPAARCPGGSWGAAPSPPPLPEGGEGESCGGSGGKHRGEGMAMEPRATSTTGRKWELPGTPGEGEAGGRGPTALGAGGKPATRHDPCPHPALPRRSPSPASSARGASSWNPYRPCKAS